MIGKQQKKKKIAVRIAAVIGMTNKRSSRLKVGRKGAAAAKLHGTTLSQSGSDIAMTCTIKKNKDKLGGEEEFERVN